ncbi:pseudouridine synthase [Paenibacillus darwinianus]|uniref:tRNA pseudouridine synthase B n=1 Tax=Paenibacillus darwinianus TaxID=1380763 RepID=A0A9W5S2R1_9BACL|nr:tRNA pseudouridine(55) synthase TruB [Paenibacillus darwinianus]EXX91211.1 pseudouridine synthase [Paenibacillus darwinianus]EXX92141.1 pseudouridine synthase [Paenibacillus darwinianus]EXX92792.1 pseudouridine synthase [Paenibacillus darwinianus]
MDGILAVWKPAGWTSHDVVAKVRRLTRIKRIGHAGTLDPQVTGVLPLCMGRATRVVEYLQELPKAYEAVLQLGISTDTEDMTGSVLERREGIRVTEQAIREALVRFTGEIEQVPPMYSAVKVDGKRLYELAREGKTVERKARRVTVYGIELTFAELDIPLPRIGFAVTCSKGTYIRTLCVDIGQVLGVPAAMAELKRTVSGGLTESDCVTLEQIEALQPQGLLEEKLLPAERALEHLPRITADSRTAQMALQGRKLPYSGPAAGASASDGLVRLFGEDDKFIGLYRTDDEADLLVPVKVFS